MKNSNLKSLLMPAVVLFAVCLVWTFLLACTNSITAPRIEQLAKDNALAARLELLPEAKDFKRHEARLNGETYEYYEGVDKAGQTTGFVFTTSANGYGGKIKVMTGVSSDGVIQKISILDISETPGLGMNILKEENIGKFAGKSGTLTVVKNKSNPAGNEITAMTGTTVTTNAVTTAVNTALDLYNSVKGGNGNG